MTYACLIKQCASPSCETWFVGTPKSRWCHQHKRSNAARIVASKHRGRASRFSREEILEMRDMFLKMPAAEIAKHFNCRRSLIYRYIERDPIRYREI